MQLSRRPAQLANLDWRFPQCPLLALSAPPWPELEGVAKQGGRSFPVAAWEVHADLRFRLPQPSPALSAPPWPELEEVAKPDWGSFPVAA